MSSNIHHRIKLCAQFVMLIGVLLLNACQVSPERRSENPAVLAERAEALYAQADYPAAAQLWESLVLSAPGNAAEWQLRAADAWLLNNQPNIAARRLAELDQTSLSPAQLAHWQLLRTELALQQGDRIAAGQLFERLTQQLDVLPPQLNERVARLNVQLGDPRLLAADAALAQLRSSATAQARQPAFNELANLPGSLLAELETGATESERAYLAQIRQARESALQQHFTLLKQPVQRRQVNPAPPPDPALAQMTERYLQARRWPDTIAVLLPQSGQLTAAAQAIHQGIITGWLQVAETQRPKLLFIDSGASNRDARGAYFSAVDSGADWIIGPLRKGSVAALIDLPNRSVPMLALNQPERSLDELSTPAREVATHYTFSLPPEDNARASARLAIQQGHRNIIVLRPESESGLRLSEAFATELNAQGGQVLQTSVYANDAIEYTDVLASALRLNESLQRHAQLQRRLGLDELGFRQQGRSDADALFIAGNSAQARLIMPQLKFLDLDYLPVYATRQVYDGTPNIRRDRDLNGIYFTQQAWLAGQPPQPLISTVNKWFPDSRNALLAELFGLGRDSLLLLPYLNMLQGETEVSLQAASGQLQISSSGDVARDLQAMRFRSGRPILLSDAPR